MSEIHLLSARRLKSIRKLHQKKYRLQEGLILCEGIRLFSAALDCNTPVSEIIVSEAFIMNPFFSRVRQTAEKQNIALTQCSSKEMKLISDETTPSGLLFLVPFKTGTADTLENINGHSAVYLENISDPGNLGAIMRSCIWFGITDIILSPECVDAGNPKTVRASAGGIFSANIFAGIEPERVFEVFRPYGYQFIATGLDNGLDLNSWQAGEKNIIFFGSEAHGLSAALTNACDQVVTIPGSKIAESLNLAVAAGIILYQLTLSPRRGV